MTSTVYTYLDATDNLASELRALSNMLTYTLEIGDSLKPSAAGIYGLYSRICDNLENSSQVLRDVLTEERGKEAVLEPATKKERQDFIFRRIRDGMELADVATAAHQTEQVVEDVLRAVIDFVPGEHIASASTSAPPPANEKVSLADYGATIDKHLSEGPIPDHFRAEALAERLSEGVDAAKIAKAVNLKPETVARVIAQLLADPADGGKATGTEG